jgi:hypothetical protein
MNMKPFLDFIKERALSDNLHDTYISETVVKVNGKYVVYPKKGGKRLGTHNTRKAALKQIAAIEASKRDRGDS